jgi:hypothetical protein
MNLQFQFLMLCFKQIYLILKLTKMSRVITKSIKQASLSLKDQADKARVDLNEEDIEQILKDLSLRHNNLSEPTFDWGTDVKKPDILEGLIEQIKSIFNVGKEVEEWSIKYYGPAQKNDKGKPASDELRISPIQKGLGGRFIVLVGTKEVPTLEVAVGSTGAENQYLMMSGDCMYLKITICPVLNVVFSNRNSEKMAPRKGFREMIIKKNPFARHIFVLDAHVSVGALASKVKKELIGITSEEVAEKIMTKSDLVAQLANKIPEPTSKIEKDNN